MYGEERQYDQADGRSHHSHSGVEWSGWATRRPVREPTNQRVTTNGRKKRECRRRINYCTLSLTTMVCVYVFGVVWLSVSRVMQCVLSECGSPVGRVRCVDWPTDALLDDGKNKRGRQPTTKGTVDRHTPTHTHNRQRHTDRRHTQHEQRCIAYRCRRWPLSPSSRCAPLVFSLPYWCCAWRWWW